MASRPRARPAHAPGPTYLAYTPNGRKLITVGLNNVIRVFTTGSDAEPINIDVVQDSHTAVAAANDFFVAGSEDGSVCKYSLTSNALDEVLVRSTLPVRDIALSPDNLWAAVATDELVVKVVNTQDMTRVLYLREQSKPVKHVSFDHSGSILAVSCADGIVSLYSLSSEEPQLVKKLDGLIKVLETDSRTSSKIIWHPDGRAFAAPTATGAIQVVSRNSWTNQRYFAEGHSGDFTAAAWSPNGALLVTAGIDNSIKLWDTRTQRTINAGQSEREPVAAFAWHPTDNLLSYTTYDGELYIHTDFVPEAQESLLQKDLASAPMLTEPLSELSGNARKDVMNGAKQADRRRAGTPDSLDDILGPDGASENGDPFIEDDDGAGYAEVFNANGKRPGGHIIAPQAKRPYGSGSAQRRYLCLNLTGFIWTVDQDTHHTVTVEFYDRATHRDFHFTDPFLYDKACLGEHGAAFACPASDQHSSLIYYPAAGRGGHVIKSQLKLRRGDNVKGLCSDGTARLVYTIENVKRDEVCQSEDIIPLPEGAELRSAFWSDNGDPFIFDSEGVLLVCLHWRTPGQAKWVPLLDTTQMDRLASGRKEETYWPVAVAMDKFHCIILKGDERYPYFPRPLLSDFEFKVPVTTRDADVDDEEEENETHKLEELYVRNSLLLDLQDDLVNNTNATHSQKTEVVQRGLEVDKALLQLLAAECREGEERGMKALEIVGLMKDRSGRMLEAAGKIATRFGRDVLGEKIAALAERRLVGLADEEEDL
ncbi:hypothetical protein MBLNU459_g8339t1 [Dothideomycetes sp. NU459]